MVLTSTQVTVQYSSLMAWCVHRITLLSGLMSVYVACICRTVCSVIICRTVCSVIICCTLCSVVILKSHAVIMIVKRGSTLSVCTLWTLAVKTVSCLQDPGCGLSEMQVLNSTVELGSHHPWKVLWEVCSLLSWWHCCKQLCSWIGLGLLYNAEYFMKADLCWDSK